MAEDGEILRQVWHANLPISLKLADNEVATLQQPDPYYIMVPRISYFPLVMDKVIKHFGKFVVESKQSGNDLWLDFDGIPLKLHYPIGLLWDLYGQESSLPWNITVHFQDFPQDELVRCNTRVAIESYFMSSVKEADALKHRSEVMKAMQKKDHNQLWLGLQNDKFDQFWAVNRKLMEHCPVQGESVTDFRHIPVRVYLLNDSSTANNSPSIIQRLVKPTHADDTRVTLKDSLSHVLRMNDTQLASFEQDSKVVIHGIVPPLDTPIQWMSEHLSYADNFLHICVFKKVS